MQGATSAISSVGGSFMDPVKRYLGLHLCCTDYVKEMSKRIDVLSATAHDMEKRRVSHNASNLMVPHYVPSWLKQVEDIKEKAERIPTGGNVFLSMLKSFQTRKQCSDIIDLIDTLEKEQAKINWVNVKNVPGDSSASTSTSEAVYDVNKNILESRQRIFKDALQSLENNEPKMVALCGMGGVGKTTMMEELKKAVMSKKTFNQVVRVVIGKKTDPIAIQRDIAESIGEPLTEQSKETRADRLNERFKKMSEDGTKKNLVILDDLWHVVDLRDIGLTNPLPKGFKLLLTSREESVCTQMGVEANLIFKIPVLEEAEAKLLFWETAGIVQTGDIDHELHKIGEDIVKKCGGLPIAINTIASTLRDNFIKHFWKDTSFRLQNKQPTLLDTTFLLFRISYDNLKDDVEKATFLLSGLFPDDYNIPTEDLMRYGWGLKFFKNVKNISTARHRVNTCVYNLIRSNLLIESDRAGCVKMHDLVRDFVLSNFSNVKQASLVNDDDISEQLTEKSYERILLKCTGMREFPADFNHPDLALLKLLDGNKLQGFPKDLAFPKDFYDRMEKLEVVAYERIRQPLLPRYSTTLRTLCLDSCQPMGDISFFGDLINLEVLSLIHCGIRELPSAIGKLIKLKLLDLTECECLCIDDGVFQRLEKLQELYIRANDGYPIRLTEDSCEGLKMLSSKLTALEVEFDNSIIQPKFVSFKKLERFKISMGCQLDRSDNRSSFINTLKLVVSHKELLEIKVISELLEKTEELDLSVNEMSSLEQISMHPSQCSFGNLKKLQIHDCADLTSIFTVNVVSGLTKLEKLKVSECPVLEYLVQGEKSEAKVIKFHKLKELRLDDLPRFVSLTDTDDVMELPQLVELELDSLPNVTSIFSENNEISVTMQPLLKKKIVTPNLEWLTIRRIEKLKEIWSCLEDLKNVSMLRKIDVEECEALVNLFPCNPMRLLGQQAVINDQPLSLFPNLMGIRLKKCESVKYLFSPLMATHLSNLKYIHIRYCDGMEEVVSNRDCNEDDEEMTVPANTILFPHPLYLFLDSLPSLKHVGGGVAKYSLLGVVHWSLCQYLQAITVTKCPSLSHVIPSHVAGQMLKVEVLHIEDCIVMKEVFATTYVNNSGGTDTALAIPRLIRSIASHKLPNLKIMCIHNCNGWEHIFTFSTLESLTKLQTISIARCKEMKVIIRKEEGEQTVAPMVVVFPHLKKIELVDLPKLEGFFLGMGEFKWPLLDDVKIIRCPKMMAFTSSKSTAPKLKSIHSIFGSYSPEWHNFYVTSNSPQTPFPSLKNGPLSLHDTIQVNVEVNHVIEEIIASNELLQLQNLEKVHVKSCGRVDAVFKVASEEVTDSELNSKSKTVVKFPKLREVDLVVLLSLKHIWKSNRWTKLEFPNLTRISILHCEELEYVLTSSMVGSLMQLQDLHITLCRSLKVIVKEDDEEDSKEEESEIITFPCLKSLKLERLWDLKGFNLGKEVDVSLPSLNILVIKECPNLEIFSNGCVAAPCLKVIETKFGIIDVGREQDINAFIIGNKF